MVKELEILNNTSPKLSVIVIAYNNELYIEEALESLNEQTFKDMEVVVVNDFSTDRTGELIDRFIEGKPKFKAIHLKENSGGCSVPRNTGIANSSGKYLMFLDGDDWYTIDACEKMVSAMERTDSDFVCGQTIRTNNYEIWYYNQIYSMQRDNINIRQFKILLFDSLSVNKLYKRSFLDKHNLRFPEGIHYEDIVFTGKAYFLAESVSVIPELIYNWRVVENANVKSITNRRYEFANFENRIIAHRFYDQFLKEIGAIHYQEHKNNKFLRHDLKLYTNDYLLFDDEYKAKFHELIHEYMHEAMDMYAFINLQEKDRIMYYLLYIGDCAGFEDYVSYMNGLPTKDSRVYVKNGVYYFRPTVENPNHESFFRLQSPQITYEINNLHLDNNTFLFNSRVRMDSIDDSEVTYTWELSNKQTGEKIYAKPDQESNVKFELGSTVPGNYYLFLHVNHEGNIFRILVKNSEIIALPNISVKDNNISKSTYINSKNSFAIKIRPIKNSSKFKWVLFKRKIRKGNDNSDGIIKTKFNNMILRVIKKLTVRKNWVFFESHMGKQYSDSPKYIYEELLQTNRKYKYIWSFEDPEQVQIPGPAIKVKKGSLKHLYYMNRSKYWVDNQGLAHIVKKKKEQVYLQTWHGTPLKKMGYDQNKRPERAQLKRLRMQTNAWNYFISNNEYSTDIFRRAFRYAGEIIETGYPRNDILIKQPSEVVKETREKLDIPLNKKVILFAPTFRDWDQNSFQKTLSDIRKLSMNIDGDTIVLLRLHYLLSNQIQQISLPSNIINVSTYQDIQELYLISDILITDYSSVMFDFALLKRPIILYCYDLQEYVTRRGLYFDLNKIAPGPVCQDFAQVIHYVKNETELNKYDANLGEFSKKFGAMDDGHAARRVVEQVFN